MNLFEGCRLFGPATCLFLLLSFVLGVVAPARGAEGDDGQIESDTLAPAVDGRSEDLALKPEGDRKAQALVAFMEGVRAESEGDVEKALAAYQRSLTYDPGNVELAVRVAEEFARRGDVAQGISILKDANKAQPKDPLPLLQLSHLYGRRLKKSDLALKYANEALDLDDENAAIYLAIYELYQELGQEKKARQILDRATKSKSEDARFWLTIGEAVRRIVVKPDGEVEPAELEKLTALYKRAVDLAGDKPEILAQAADFFVLTRQFKEATPLYRRLMALGLSEENPVVATAPFKLALSMHGSGQRKEAIEFLHDILKHNPQQAQAYEMLGQLYQEEGDIAKALSSYQKCLLQNPEQPIIYLRVADMFLRANKPEESVSVIEEARNKFPHLARFAYMLAVALSQAKRHADALAMFERAEQELSAASEPLDAEFYYHWGAAAERAGDISKAAEFLRKSLAMNPKSAEVANYLGYMWIDRGENLDEAGQLVERALEIEPENGAYLDSRGWYYFKKGDFKRALKDLLAAARVVKPEDAVVYDHIADTYQQLGNMTEAINYWQKAAALEPGNEKIAAKLAEAKKQMTALPPEPSRPLDASRVQPR
jgi:tetratricopeptide (TPR) repeat protein